MVSPGFSLGFRGLSCYNCLIVQWMQTFFSSGLVPFGTCFRVLVFSFQFLVSSAFVPVHARVGVPKLVSPGQWSVLVYLSHVLQCSQSVPGPWQSWSSRVGKAWGQSWFQLSVVLFLAHVRHSLVQVWCHLRYVSGVQTGVWCQFRLQQEKHGFRLVRGLQTEIQTGGSLVGPN